MKTNEEQSHEIDLPQLRIFRGEEGDEVIDQSPTDPPPDGQAEWANVEEYWAGRNRAKRISARWAA